MPEVAEVRLIADTIERFLVGRHLTQLRVTDPVKLVNWVAKSCSSLAQLNAKLDKCNEGLLVISVNTRGKFCWLECEASDIDIPTNTNKSLTSPITSSKVYIGIQFGMSGNIRPEPTKERLASYKKDKKGKQISREEYLKHCHISFDTKEMESSPDDHIYYHDIRRFGRFEVFWLKDQLDNKLAKLGHDPLSQEQLSRSDIIAKFRQFNHQNICKALMEQELLAGVGNFIKSETLYEAKIYPFAIIRDIPDDSLFELYQAVCKISKDDYASGGATLYTFTGMKGDQSDFKETLKVYGHGAEKDANGYFIIRIPEAESPDKRTTFWVREVQTVGNVITTVSNNDMIANASMNANQLVAIVKPPCKPLKLIPLPLKKTKS